MALHRVVLILVLGMVFGCGGGDTTGSSTSSHTSSGSSNSSNLSVSYNLYRSFVNDVQSLVPRTYTVSGKEGTIIVTGEGTETPNQLFTTTFENKSAQRRTVKINDYMSYNGNGYPNEKFIDEFYDFDYKLLGIATISYYIVNTNIIPLPSITHVNDQGHFYDANIYWADRRSTQIGTVSVTYKIRAESASTALVDFDFLYNFTIDGGYTEQRTDTYRINTLDTLVLITKKIIKDNGRTISTYTYN